MASLDTAAATPASSLQEPLPLTPFESYMIADDQPEYPMTFVARFQFDGRVDQEAFSAALATALARNPLLTARLDEDDRLGPCWVAGDTTPVLDFGPDSAPLTGGCARPIDLHHEPGLRTWVRVGDDTSRIIFQFHHACCDGVGGSHFFEDLLVAYANQFDGGGPELRPLDIDRLKRRGNFDIPQRSFVQRFLDTLITLRGAYKFLFIGSHPLATPGDVDTAKHLATNDEGFIRQILPPNVSKQLRKSARRQGASLNDLLLRDLFLVIRDWNHQLESKSDRDRLRINVPISLRSRDDSMMPAANLMSFAFLTRNVSACDSPDELLRNICEETKVTVRERHTLYFLGALAAANSFGILRRSLRGNRCLSTAVLTNMGDPTRRFIAQLPRRGGLVVAGNLTLTNNSGIPPMRPLTRAVFASGSYGQRLTISLRCDPHSFSPADTRRLLDQYASQLAKSAE